MSFPNPDPMFKIQATSGLHEGKDTLDVQPINLQGIRQAMPPGVEPLADFFDVLSLQEDLRAVDDSRLKSRVAFTLRASYEHIRGLELGLVQMGEAVERLEDNIRVIRSKGNAEFQNSSGETYTFQIQKSAAPAQSWGIPGRLIVRVTHSSRFGSDSVRAYHYVLLEDEYEHLAPTPWAQAWDVVQKLAGYGPAPIGDKGWADPEDVFDALKRNTLAREEQDLRILKLCGVEEHDDTTVMDAVRNLAEHTTQLSHENVELRKKLEDFKKGDVYVHPRRYVQHLESTLVAIGRLLGHKTFPTVGDKVPYDHQMTNYCSRLLQAVRTRMNNIKSKKGAH